jgi:hypothetical protein
MATMKKATQKALRLLADIGGLYLELVQSATRLVPGRS